ncbi:MAG: outer membrane lipoprotein-sorting protein [Candidatus Krumholzibacteriota bacterium]|nr:outer membrane lipoprotein-sorting protein [Candidatus Krumholzibacteriota bacterium]
MRIRWLTAGLAGLLLIAPPAPAGRAQAPGAPAVAAPEDTTALAAAAPADSAAPAVTELLRGLDELYESTGTRARVEIRIVKPGRTRTLRMETWSRGEDEALVVIEAPPRDAGTATLKVGRNLWNYLPKIARSIRVPPSMMMGSWMGTDLTNDDLVRSSSYEEDYASELVGRSSDPPGWLVALAARPGVAGLWERVEVVFGDDGLPLVSRYYDRRGRLSRTMRFTDVRELGGRRVPATIVVIPEREEGRRTELRYLDVTFDLDLDDDLFSLARLERRR